MNFAVVNLGCKVNRVESDAFAEALLVRGAKSTKQEQAQLIIVNTCTVTGEAEKKTRKAVRHALRANAHASVVVTGCAAALDASFYEGLDRRVSVAAKGKLLDDIKQGRWGGQTDALLADACAQPLRLGEGFRTRVGVKIQDGCNNACTYCIVHVARGRAWSRPAEEVVQECVELTRAGVKEIVLTGINLGSYSEGSRHQSDAVRLSDLLEQLLEATKDASVRSPHYFGLPVRFRLSSIEPRDVSDKLIDLLSQANGRICRHVHLPLQSGSSKVLREMARPYDADFYRGLVEKLRRRVPEITLSTDIIVGFPGETADDFQETLHMARQVGFMKIHTFPYSQRVGTPAALRSDQIEPQERARRATVLRTLADELRFQEYTHRVGLHEEVLVEQAGFAVTESYFVIPAPPDLPPGTLVEATLPTLSKQEVCRA